MSSEPKFEDNGDRKITLKPGDVCVVLRPLPDEKYQTIIFHNHIGQSDDDALFSHLMARGLAHVAIEDADYVFKRGAKSYDEGYGELQKVNSAGEAVQEDPRKIDLRLVKPKGNA